VLWPLQWRYPPNNARLTCANLIIANAAAISARVAGSLIGYRASTNTSFTLATGPVATAEGRPLLKHEDRGFHG
jgi:hypothetical protein